MHFAVLEREESHALVVLTDARYVILVDGKCTPCLPEHRLGVAAVCNAQKPDVKVSVVQKH